MIVAGCYDKTIRIINPQSMINMNIFPFYIVDVDIDVLTRRDKNRPYSPSLPLEVYKYLGKIGLKVLQSSLLQTYAHQSMRTFLA